MSSFFEKPSSIFIENQTICRPTIAVSLASEKSNSTGTMFEVTAVCFWISLVQNLKKIKVKDVGFIVILISIL